MKPILTFAVYPLIATVLFASLAFALLLARPALPEPTHHLFTTYGVMPADVTCAYSGMGSGDEAYYCHAPLDDGFVSRAGYSVERGQVTHVYLTMDNLRTEDLLLSEGWPAMMRQWQQSIVMCWPTEFNGLDGALLATIRRNSWGTLYSRYGGLYRGIRRWFDSTLNGVRGSVGWVRMEFDPNAMNGAGWGCL